MISIRAIVLVLVYLFVAASAGSILAWLLVDLINVPYPKLLSRSVLLFAGLGLIPLWRASGLSTTSVGLSPIRWRQALSAYPLGALVMLPLMLFFVVVKFRVWDPRIEFSDTDIWRFVVLALFSSALVGLFEETLFRGVFFSALRRRGSFIASAVFVSLVYAAVHFLAADEHVVQEVTWYAGYANVVQAFSGLAHPTEYWDGFVALFLLGLLFCWVREHFGLWYCIGLHAAWVFALRLFKQLTVRDIYSPYQVMASDYDNFVGELASIWLIFLFVVIALVRRHRARDLPSGSIT